MNLGFDLDEVIGQTAQMAMDHMNEVLKCNFTTDVLESFFFDQNAFSEDPDEQKAIVDTLIHAVFDTDKMATVKPYPGASRILNKLKHQGHKIFVITKRHKKDLDMTVNWLQQHKIPFDKVIVTHFEEKGSFANKLKLDFFLDDLDDNLYEMYKAKARWQKGLFLMTRPWNANKYIDSSKIGRVNSWDEVLKVVGLGNRLRS